MTISCDNCLKEFKYPYLLLRHKKRKRPCKKIENTITIPNNSKTIPKQFQIIPNHSKTIPNNSKIIPNDSNTFFCKYCCKEFKYKNNLYRHKNQLRCKKMPKNQIAIIKETKTLYKVIPK